MIGVKKEDKVLILSGKDKGKKSKIIAVFPDKRMVIVENVNVVKKHMKKTQKTSGGIYEKESLINISKVMLVCRKCGNASRFKYGGKTINGERIRLCRKCNEHAV